MIKSNKNIRWGFISQILNSGINIMLLPFVIIYLSSEELGLWYTFVAIGALVMLLDFGFSTTMVRNIAYTWNGAKEISANNFKSNNSFLGVNKALFSEIFTASKKIYFYLSILSFLLLSVLGTFYIYKITNSMMSLQTAISSWWIYLLAIVINIYYLYWTPVLKGTGLIKNYYQINTISKLAQLLITIIMLVLGSGLLGVTLAYLISTIITRITSKVLFFKNNGYFQNLNDIPQNKSSEHILKKLLPSMYKQAIISISNYIIDKFPIILSGMVFGLAVTSELGLTIQIMTVFSTLGNVAYNTFLPEMIKNITIGNPNKSYSLLYKSLFLQFVFISIGTIIVLTTGKFFLGLINSNTSILPLSSILLLSLYVYLFNFQLVCINFIIVYNEFPMIKSYLITALSMITLITLLSVFFKTYGVNLIFISQLIPLIAYNLWKWPLYISRKMNISIKKFYLNCILINKNTVKEI